MVNAFLLVALVATASARSDTLSGLCSPAREGVAVDLTGTSYRSEQSYAPAETVAEVDARQSMLLLADGRFLLRTSSLYPGDIEFRFRTVGDRTGESTIDELGWREGDVLQRDDAATSARDLAELRMLVPALLACDALERGAPRAGVDDGALAFKDGAGREVTLTFGADGELAGARLGETSYRYENWHVREGQRVPGRIVVLRGSRETTRWTRIHARPARPGDEALLSLPEGYRAADPAGPLRATTLGEGAYRIDGAPSGYHTGFVVGERGVMLFDAPVDVEEARQVRARIEAIAGRPVTHVVISHVHGDHVAGLPAYRDAEVLVGAGGAAALRRQLDESLPSRVREVDTGEEVDLGGRRVRILPLASAHSPTMLVGFDARSGTLFQGDLFYIPERGAVPAGFATGRELIALIDAASLPVHAIVGVHGRTGTPRDLHDAVARIANPADRGCVGEQMTRPDRCAPGAQSNTTR